MEIEMILINFLNLIGTLYEDEEIRLEFFLFTELLSLFTVEICVIKT